MRIRAPNVSFRHWIVLVSVAMIAGASSAALSRDCVRLPLDVAVDVGHSARSFGATSSRGGREYDFNLRFSQELLEASARDSRLRLRALHPEGSSPSLKNRVSKANALGPDLLISIHHDSAHPKLLKPWVYEGKTYLASDEIAGFSIFVSKSNPKYATALRFAEAIGSAWKAVGHKPTLHHAADIAGERRTLLNPDIGLYLAPFAVIERTRVPAVLLEIGVLINPLEEAWLLERENRQRLQAALLEALTKTGCGASG